MRPNHWPRTLLNSNRLIAFLQVMARMARAGTDEAPDSRIISTMTGTFELVVTTGGDFEFRLLSRTGKVLAVSGKYRDKNAAVAGIRDAQECAAMALINDRTPPPSLTMTPSAGKRQTQQGPSRWFG